MTNNQVADRAARLTLDAFDAFNATFQAITCRAQKRFEERDWQRGRQDAVDRLDSYDGALNQSAVKLDDALGAAARMASVWGSAKHRFASPCCAAVRHRPGRNLFQFCHAQNVEHRRDKQGR